ncbi:MAG: division/cell wall cluster transcriptional repressor MraZ [Actinomycetia bacterium]|nr:division/cell wall cluster transcriptional repressor MraZ [Actinomycetes bacterium]
MFLGEYKRVIDKKGRIFIPSKFREDLFSGVIISKGFDERCLFLFSREGWTKLRDRIISMPVTKKNTQKFSRWFFSSATEEGMDQQGRVKIPQSLIEYSQIKKDIVLVGVSDRAEIWAKEVWDEYYRQADDQFMGKDTTFEDLGF